MVIRENAPTKVPLSQKISTLYINTYSNMSLYLKTDVPEMLVSIRINTRFGGRDNTSSDNTTYRIRRSISHASGGGFQARLLDNQEGATSAITELYVSGKLSAGCSNADLCWHRHRHYSSCGDIEHVKSAQGGDAHRPIRYERRVQ